MRVVVTFFLFVCFLLLGGMGSACAGNLCSNAPFLPAHNRVNAGGETGKQDFLLTNPHDLPTDSDSPLLAEDDDDDDQENFTRKAKPSVEGFLIPFALVSSSLLNNLTSHLFFQKYRPYTGYCKYILQRTLRI